MLENALGVIVSTVIVGTVNYQLSPLPHNSCTVTDFSVKQASSAADSYYYCASETDYYIESVHQTAYAKEVVRKQELLRQKTAISSAVQIKGQPLHLETSQLPRVEGGLSPEALFQMINTHRSQKGLPPYQQHPELCAAVASRAPELHTEIFGGRGMHAGFRKLNLPFRATENMIHQQTEEKAMNWWLNSSVHRRAIEGNYTHACGACSGNSCAMIFGNP